MLTVVFICITTKRLYRTAISELHSQGAALCQMAEVERKPRPRRKRIQRPFRARVAERLDCDPQGQQPRTFIFAKNHYPTLFDRPNCQLQWKEEIEIHSPISKR